MTEQTILKRRFIEFQNTHDWEQRKLGELADFSKGNGYSKGDLVEKGSPIILYGRLYVTYETVINEVDTFVEIKDKSVISEGNEVIVPASGETSEEISRASVVGKSGIILGGDLNIIKPKSEIDPIFLALTISNGKQQKEMSKRAQGKSVVHLHNSDLKHVSFFYPKLEEQQKIGQFFVQLDHLIALHQRKLEKTKALKSAYLSEMFPAEGEREPKRRFAGFTDDWEQRKLGDELSLLKDGTHGTHKNVENGPYLLSAKNIKNGEIKITESDRKISQEEYKQIHKSFQLKTGDVLLTIVGSIGEAAVLHDPAGITFQRSVAYLRPSEIEPNFLYTLVTGPDFQKQLKNRQVVSAQPGIYLGDLAKIDIIVPTKKEEQKQISLFFNHLENLITLHQRKLEKLQNIKKAYLNEMFV